MPVNNDARSLLQQYLSAFAAKRNLTEALYFVNLGGGSGQSLTGKTWIVANIHNASWADIDLLRALIEVVGQLSKSVDFHYVSVGGNPAPTEYDVVEQLMSSDGPRFVLNLHRLGYGRTQPKLLQYLLLKDSAHFLGTENANLLAKLTSRGRKRSGGDDAGGKKPGLLRGSTVNAPRIELCLVLESTKLVSELRALATILGEIAKHEQTKCVDSDAVRFEITTLWLQSEKLLVPIEIEILTDMIASESSTIRHLQIANSQMMLSVNNRLQVFQHFLRSTVCALEDSKPTLQSLRLQKVPRQVPSIASICSALRYPNSLKDLSLEWVWSSATDETLELIWAWIAFGIFHPDSEAKLDRLNLTGLPSKHEYLRKFEHIISDSRTGREVWMLQYENVPQGGELREVYLPPHQRVFVQLEANTKMRVGPKPGAKVLDVTSLDLEEFEAIINLTTWVCVVVPGCDFAWVPSTSIVSRRETPSKCPDSGVVDARVNNWPLAGANVKAFTRHPMMGTADHQSDIKHMLRMFGHGLEALNYPSHGLEFDDLDLREILSFCPNLTHLNLKGNSLASVGPLGDRYRSQQCRISSLNIDFEGGDVEALTQLAELLESSFSKPLQRVAVSGAIATTDCWETLEKALKSNQTLQLMVVYSVNSVHRENLTRIQAEFEGSTLPLCSKIAFLSAIRSYSCRPPGSKVSRSSLGKLDSNLVSQVFAFAGIRVLRSFYW